MIEAVLTALSRFDEPLAIGMILLGAVLGILFGALPGFSPVTGMALLLPFTFGMDPMIAMILFAGVMGSAHFGGSIPAILLNTPGTAPNACTCFDGFPLARRGEAARAIAISATSAGIGTVFGLVILMVGIPIVRPFILSFMMADFFWLIIFGLVTIAFASKGNLLKGLGGGGLGILLALIGFSPQFAVERFTLNSYYLWDGLQLVPLVIGIFAISEIIVYASRGGTIAEIKAKGQSAIRWGEQVKMGIKDVLSRPLIFLRSSAIGAIIGAVPGVGGAAANFISYTVSMQSSKHPEEYGKGSVEGLISSEVANDAKDGPAILPTTAFGIPGSPDTAILLAALILHGLTPGPLLLRDDLSIIMMLIFGIFFSQIFTSGAGLLTANLLARITTIRVHYLAPFILVLCIAGAFAYRNYIWDVLLAVGLGLVGYLLKKYDFRVITIVIGYMLGNMAERYFFTSLQISGGSYLALISSPISVVLIILIVFMLSFPFLKGWVDRYRARKSGRAAAVEAAEEKALEADKAKQEKFKFWKSGEFIFTAALALFALSILVSSFAFEPRVRIVPILISTFTLLMMSGLLIGHFFPTLMRKVNVGLEDVLGVSTKSSECKAEEITDKTPVSRIIFWILGFFVAIFLIGLPVSIPLFIFCYLLIQGKFGLARSVIVAAVLSVAVFLMLHYLDVTLWTGAIPRIIPGILGGSNIPRI